MVAHDPLLYAELPTPPPLPQQPPTRMQKMMVTRLWHWRPTSEAMEVAMEVNCVDQLPCALVQRRRLQLG